MKILFRKYGKIKSEINDALNPQGIGLGLVISKILAEELSPESHKKFLITSEIGKGTTFTFYIENALKENEGSPKSKFSITKEENNSLNENENLEIKDKNFEILNQAEIQLFTTNIFRKSDSKILSNSLVKIRSSSKDLSINKKIVSTNMILFPVMKCLCPKILVVDDDMFNVICLQELLKMTGFESNYAANGSDAIAKVNERNEKRCCENCLQYKLIFIDSKMPILTGVEATKIIKQVDFLNNIKIIGCSGDNDLEKFRIAGADGFLKKPIERKELVNILNEYKDLLNFKL
jgi:CheY-like chemotaxis protein